MAASRVQRSRVLECDSRCARRQASTSTALLARHSPRRSRAMCRLAS